MEQLDEGGSAQDMSAGQQPTADDIERAKAWLAREFGIDAALVGVPKLSRVMGVSASTIYAHMRAGKFAIRYRMLNTTPMVSMDDLARWYCDPPEAAPAPPPAEPSRPMPSPADGEGWVDALVARALDKIGPGATRSRRGPGRG